MARKRSFHIFLIALFCKVGAFAAHSWVEEQICEDFMPFSDGISEKQLDETMEWSKGWSVEGSSLIRVKIIDGVCYQFNNEGQEVNLPGISYHLQKIMAKEDLPNLDFIYFYGAGPDLDDDYGVSAKGPVLAGNKVDGQENVILFHDRMTGVSNDHYSWKRSQDRVEQAMKSCPWETKLNKLVWYGQISDFKEKSWGHIENWWDYSKRGKLYMLSSSRPDLMEVGITGFHELKWRHISPEIPEAEFKDIAYHMKNKYQIVLDGYTCSNPSYAWRLLSDCACLKVDSSKRQWFYRGLEEGVHYISIESDFSTLFETIEILQKNDEYAHQIALNGREWAKQNLVDERPLIEYCSKVLQKYASLQTFDPKLSDEEVRQVSKSSPYAAMTTLLPFNGHGFFSAYNAEALSFLMKKYCCKTVIELGSWLGASTRHIAKALPKNGVVFAVDHWEGSHEHHQPHRTDVQRFLPILYQQFLSNCIHEKLEDKIIPIKMTTLEAAKRLNVQADLIFVDASHDEKSVYEDLLAWYPHLKQEGILCGDDWMWNKNTPNGEYSIQRAVTRFAKEHGLYIETHGPTFWMLKKNEEKKLPFNE